LCEIENKLKTIISGSIQEYFGTSWLVKGLPKNTYTKAKKLRHNEFLDWVQLRINYPKNHIVFQLTNIVM